MLTKLLLCLALAASGTAASAQSLDTLAHKSALIRKDLDYLKLKRAVSIYASTKEYCPSNYWWSNAAYASKDAKRNYAQQLTGTMSKVGFSKAQIAHCAENSSFVLLNGSLQSHPKNAKHISLVESAVMIVRDRATRKKTAAPVTVESGTWGGQRYQRVFSANFKEVCRTSGSWTKAKTTCKGYGKLTGRMINEGQNRTIYQFSNSKYEMTISTRRPKSYASSRFDRLFK
jgi:hypothetical protein